MTEQKLINDVIKQIKQDINSDDEREMLGIER